MTFRNLDGSQVSEEECVCRGYWSLECPVDVHRARWLQSHMDWSDVEANTIARCTLPDVPITQYKPASLFGDDYDEGEELKMGKANGFIDRKMFMELLRKRIGNRSAKLLAPEFGVSYQFLYKVLAGIYDPGPSIAKALGFEQFVGYRRVKAVKKTQKRPRERKTKPSTSKAQPHL